MDSRLQFEDYNTTTSLWEDGFLYAAYRGSEMKRPLVRKATPPHPLAGKNLNSDLAATPRLNRKL